MFQIDEQTSEPILETMSTEDSGIGRELSENLSNRSLKRGMVLWKAKCDPMSMYYISCEP